MVRRTIALALAGLAIAAPPALATYTPQWHSQMQDATHTASRTAGGCSIRPGWHQSLIVACAGKHAASLVYAFPVSSSGRGPAKVQGKPTSGVSWWGRADVHRSVNVAGDTLRVTVTVSNGTAQLNSVSVGYYA
jgi:hypothetical protein